MFNLKSRALLVYSVELNVDCGLKVQSVSARSDSVQELRFVIVKVSSLSWSNFAEEQHNCGTLCGVGRY